VPEPVSVAILPMGMLSDESESDEEGSWDGRKEVEEYGV
jgi:hypothetical protein